MKEYVEPMCIHISLIDEQLLQSIIRLKGELIEHETSSDEYKEATLDDDLIDDDFTFEDDTSRNL